MTRWEDMVQAWKTSSGSDLLFQSTKNNLAHMVSAAALLLVLLIKVMSEL